MKIGKKGFELPRIGLGCMGLSHAYGDATNNNDAIRFLKEAYNSGYTFFDTAEVYTGTTKDGVTSNNEELVGRALEDVRDDVVIASKFGVEHKGTTLKMDSRPETIIKSVHKSLERLNVDYIDLYYQHRIDSRIEPETVAEVMQKLIDENLIRSWGISEANEDYLRRANDICPVTAIQNRYSMLARWHEDLFSVCEELNVYFVAFSPMANGFLTGKFNSNSIFGDKDFRNSMPQYTSEAFKKAEDLIVLIKQIAEKHDASMSQISLAWMMCKKDYIIPIPGTTSNSNMKNNYQAINIKLSQKEIKALDEKLDQLDIPVFGGHG